MALEIERKYLDADVPAMRRILMDLAASSGGAHFESNLVFDDGACSLFARGLLLRLRLREWSGKNDCVLTTKQAAGKEEGQSVKIREETECAVADFQAMYAILVQLGYHVAWRYEKIRESWQWERNRWHGPLKIDIDLLPFGNVIELEGSRQAIEEGAAFLGLDKCRTSISTYHELGREWLRARGAGADANLVFEPDIKKQLRASLGLPNM